MVGKDNLCAIRDEKIAIHFYAGRAQGGDLLQEGQWIDAYAVANDARALGAQNTAGHELQDELFSVDDDGVSGIVAACITSHHREGLGQYVDNLPLTLVAPLGSDNDRSSASARLTSAQMQTPLGILRGRKSKPAPGSHTLAAPLLLLNRLGNWEDRRNFVGTLQHTESSRGGAEVDSAFQQARLHSLVVPILRYGD